MSLKRVQTEEAQTLRPHKKQRMELEVVIQALKKPEVYLKVKWNYLFRVHMVKRKEAEERMAAALERLMKWVEETEKNWRSWGLEKGSNKEMNIVFFKNKQ